MCEKCKPLIECPVGQKRKNIVDREGEGKITDPYDRELTIGPVVMFVDKYPDGHVDCGVYREVYDENSVHYGGGFTISHCPFCGEKLF